jgi:hypothetical protein
MYKYEAGIRGIEKDGHTMFEQDVVQDLNRKSYLEARVLLLDRALLPKKIVVVCGEKLKASLLAVDSWEGNESELEDFIEIYANKETEVFEQHGDYFILEDNNVPMPKDSFMFVSMMDEISALNK